MFETKNATNMSLNAGQMQQNTIKSNINEMAQENTNSYVIETKEESLNDHTQNSSMQSNELNAAIQISENIQKNDLLSNESGSKNDTFDSIIDTLSKGSTLSKTLAMFQVSPRQWVKQLNDDPKLMAEYNLVRGIKADLMADELLDIADDETLEIGRAFNMIQARKWVASKYAPKAYGDKLDITVTKTVDITLALSDARKRLDAIEAETRPISIETIVEEDKS